MKKWRKIYTNFFTNDRIAVDNCAFLRRENENKKTYKEVDLCNKSGYIYTDNQIVDNYGLV